MTIRPPLPDAVVRTGLLARVHAYRNGRPRADAELAHYVEQHAGAIFRALAHDLGPAFRAQLAAAGFLTHRHFHHAEGLDPAARLALRHTAALAQPNGTPE